MRLDNYNDRIQHTVMADFIACPKIKKITKLKSSFRQMLMAIHKLHPTARKEKTTQANSELKFLMTIAVSFWLAAANTNKNMARTPKVIRFISQFREVCVCEMCVLHSAFIIGSFQREKWRTAMVLSLYTWCLCCAYTF